MGGSGGGGWRPLGDIRSLESKAKEILKGERRNVFISFAFEDVDEVNLLRAQSKNEQSDIEFNDRSIQVPYDSERSEYIRARLSERINQSSTTIVYASPNMAASAWVKWEVEKSLELGKRVIVVHKGSRAPALPAWIGEKRLQVVPWAKLSATL